MSASSKLAVLYRAVPLFALLVGLAVAITGMYLLGTDLNEELTLGGLTNVLGILAAAYLVAFWTESLLSKVSTPWRQRLNKELDAVEDAVDYPVDVAEGIAAYLDDLRHGLPLAVEMATYPNELPATPREWADYRLNQYRLDALHAWHEKRSA